MTRLATLLSAFSSFLVFGLASVDAGSAVVVGPHHQLATAYGGPMARERALDNARHRYGANVRILAESDVNGYGAIAVARHPNGIGWIIGVSLGNRSASEANSLAIDHCVKLGGRHPQVKWAFKG
jgi:hypothetical protein